MGSVIFQKRQDIHAWLYKRTASFLKETQRKRVEELLSRELDQGAVTAEEVSRLIRRDLRALRDERVLSAFEYQNLVTALEELLREAV